MKKLMALTAVATALFATRASAANLDENSLTLDENSAVIEEVTGKNLVSLSPQAGAESRDIGTALVIADQVVNLVDKILDLIAKNQPVVTQNIGYANAVPYGISHWTQMQGWSKPSTKQYSFTVKNKTGGNAVSVLYQVHWTHSGNYQGIGKYLTGVTIEPLKVTTAYGYTVDLTAEVPDSTVANVGTSADPIASMQVQLKWKVHSIFSDVQEKAIYYVRGDGAMEAIGTPFNRALEQKNQEKMEAVAARLSNIQFN